jgi:hypothetical protein
MLRFRQFLSEKIMQQSYIKREILAFSTAIGFCSGASYGFNHANKHQHGFVWKSTFGGVLGGSCGFVFGFFLKESICLLIISDLYKSYVIKQQDNIRKK